MADFDAVVIGAGMVGLAIAARLGASGQRVLVLEAADTPGSLTSARNSEVVHAGLYYPTGSLKHRLCLEGGALLAAYLDARGIGLNRCGKLVVATDDAEVAAIEALAERARTNGVAGIQLLGPGAVARRAPALRAVAALWSPMTAVFDSHACMQALQADIAAADGVIALRTPFVAAEEAGADFLVHSGGPDPFAFTTRRLVNAAGLFAPAVAARIAPLPAGHIPRQWLAKGSYFALAGRAPFKCLVYPAPVDGGLGIHLTLDLAGQVRFGPDVEWLDPAIPPEAVDYRVDPGRAAAFAQAIRRYWPDLPDGALRPDYAGCRPKLSGPGGAAADFRIDTAAQHGVGGLVNLFGIESPGLTSALAIARRVAEVLD